MVYKSIFNRTNRLNVNQSASSSSSSSACSCSCSFSCPTEKCNSLNNCRRKIFDPQRCKRISLILSRANFCFGLLSLLIVSSQLPDIIDCLPTSLLSSRSPRQVQNVDSTADQTDGASDGTPAKIIGFRLEGDSKNIIENDERYTIKSDQEVTMRLYGLNMREEFFIGLSWMVVIGKQKQKSIPCQVDETAIFEARRQSEFVATATIKLPANKNGKPYFLCVTNGTHDDEDQFVLVSPEAGMQINSEPPILPMWLHMILIVVLLLLSGLFSGLNLGLMALDKNELQVIERCGTEDEKYHAKTIAPVRKRGNYLLCTLLLGNVLVNSTLTILLDDLTSGIFAVILSTLSIVIFGEIIPQALCSRHGLAVGAKTVYITYLFMILTFPLSYPISRLLDKILGEEIGSVYDRERLMEYIRVTKDYNNLEADEMNIISGALKFKNISVSDVMTPLSDVFMLPYDTILNFDTLTLINNSGYSRIPVYESRDNVVGLLHVKDLSLIDPDHNTPLKAVLDFYSRPLLAVFEDVKLDKMLNEFKLGKSHMALVRRIIDNGINDPYYEIIGVVTLEDIIEELIQAEINDETDVISDNRRRQKRVEVQNRPNYLEFIRNGFRDKNSNCGSLDCTNQVTISPQLALAALRFLASSVGPFGRNHISEEVLKNLISQRIYYEAKGQPRKANLDEMSPENVLYRRGQPADYFIMILEGRARVIVTKENQEYDAGPFCCFGIIALQSNVEEQNRLSIEEVNQKTVTDESLSQRSSNQNISQVQEFFPDYTLICLERVVYMKISKEFHQMALKTTHIERKRSVENDKFDSRQDLTKNLKNLPSKYRKISMSTNLPDFSLVHDTQNDNKSLNDDRTCTNHLNSSDRPRHLSNELNTKPRSFEMTPLPLALPPPAPPSPLPATKSNELKRSDAIELLPEGNTPRSYGSIESLTAGDPANQALLPPAASNTDTVDADSERKSKMNLVLNGSATTLNLDDTHNSSKDETETSTLI